MTFPDLPSLDAKPGNSAASALTALRTELDHCATAVERLLDGVLPLATAASSETLDDRRLARLLIRLRFAVNGLDRRNRAAPDTITFDLELVVKQIRAIRDLVGYQGAEPLIDRLNERIAFVRLQSRQRRAGRG